MPESPQTPIRVAVIGGGAFGRNHLRVYRELELADPHLIQLAALVEPDAERRAAHAATYNIPTYASVADLLAAQTPTKNSGTPHPATDPGAPHLDSEMWAGKNLDTGDSHPATKSGAPHLDSEMWAGKNLDTGDLHPAKKWGAPHLDFEMWAGKNLDTGDSQPATKWGAPHLDSEMWAGDNPQPSENALKGTGFSPSIPAPDESGALAPEGRIHAASICVPTLHHAAVAQDLLRANIDILIEKPFAATLEEADHLITLAQQNHRIVAIGHLERFNPAVTATMAALNNPMFFEAHRLSIFTPRSLDVDVVLDLMIHDLDIVLALVQSPVREVRAVGLPVLSRKTDIANVRIEFESGCIANFTASRVSTEQVRKLRLFQPHQYLSLDFARQELLTISVDPAILAINSATNPGAPHLTTKPGAPHLDSEMWAGKNLDTGDSQPTTKSGAPHLDSEMWAGKNLDTGDSQPTTKWGAPHLDSPSFETRMWAGDNPQPSENALKGTGFSPSIQAASQAGALAPEGAPQHPTPGLTLTKSNIPKGEPLRLELEDFLTAVRNRTQPRVPAEAGRAALALALEINAHIAAHAHRITNR